MQLLCHPARPRRIPEPLGRRPCSTKCGGVSHRATGRSYLPGSISAAIGTARPAMPCRASCVRSARPRSGTAAPVVDRDQPRRRRARVGAAGNANVSRHLHVPLQSGDDGVLRDMARRYTSATFLRRARAARRLQPHHRCDRRLSDRRRACFPQHALGCGGSRNHKSPCLSVLAATGNGHCRRRRCRACGQEGSERPAARGLASGVSRALA